MRLRLKRHRLLRVCMVAVVTVLLPRPHAVWVHHVLCAAMQVVSKGAQDP